tara:strand:- start:846 stop:1007 length:162 start_codon:yes stop_codon:yes gene_type:complete
MNYFVGLTITLPETDDREIHIEYALEIAKDVLSVMTGSGNYGEISIEFVEQGL